MASEPGISFIENFDTNCLGLDVSMDNNDLFMTDGIMNPKELYLTEEESGLVKDAASSSDSGISTFDDLQDIANVTDLNSLMDGDLRDLDFGIEFALHTADHDVFDPAVLVKEEPLSPASDGSTCQSTDSALDFSCLQQPVSPQFCNFHNEITIKEECGVDFSSHDQIFVHRQQQHSSPYSHADVISHQPLQQQQQQQQFDSLYNGASHFSASSPTSYVLSPSTHHSEATMEAALSSPSSSTSSSSSYEPLMSLVHASHKQQQQQQQQHNNVAFKMSPNSSPSPGQPHGYVVVPTSPQQSQSSGSGSVSGPVRKIVLGTKRLSVLPAQSLRQPVRQLSSGSERDLAGLSQSQCVSPTSLSSSLSSPSSSSMSMTALASSCASYQIDAILNSNIRIQPKPGADVK
ncbi:hypothetical protein EGW08_011826, partial [Elysia chlorotica]